MKKFTKKLTNSIDTANWDTIKLTHLRNNTTNYFISLPIFNRECDEYDAGKLNNEHELYLGERYA